MAMMCGEVMSLASMRDAKVLAGSEGLNRPLRWIYVAECFADITQVADWIFGGELVFISGVNIKENPDALTEVVRRLIEKKAAGAAVFIGPYIPEISKEVLEIANQFAFPIIELPWEAKLVTVSHDICHAITVKEIEEKTLDNLLVSILFGEPELEEHIQIRAEYYGYLPNRPSCICIADIEGFARYIKEHEVTKENAIVELKLNLKRLIQNGLGHRGKAPIVMMRSDSVISLVQTGKETQREFFSALFEEVQEEIKRLYPGIRLNIGVGGQYDTLALMRKSLDEAELALRAGKCRVTNERFSYYDDIGIFSILFEVSDKRVLDRYCKATLGAVLEYDRLNNATLLHTLEVYLESDGNMLEISEKLFIHKNTLKYRIIKIEEITGLSVKSVSDCIRLELGLMIRRLLEQDKR